MNKTCGDCHFWHAPVGTTGCVIDADAPGRCQGLPPAALRAPDGLEGTYLTYPPVTRDYPACALFREDGPEEE